MPRSTRQQVPVWEDVAVEPRDIELEALEAYEGAEERRQGIIAAWEEEGRPLISVGHTGQPVVHPLVKMINEAEVICDRLRQRVKPKRMGREPEAVIKPYRAKRITRLQAVPKTEPKPKATSKKTG
jgi:hypothetical protein